MECPKWIGTRRMGTKGLELGLVGHARRFLRTRYSVSLMLAFGGFGASILTLLRGWIRGVTSRLKGKMLLDMVGGIIEDYDYLWEEYHFSTATM